MESASCALSCSPHAAGQHSVYLQPMGGVKRRGGCGRGACSVQSVHCEWRTCAVGLTSGVHWYSTACENDVWEPLYDGDGPFRRHTPNRPLLLLIWRPSPLARGSIRCPYSFSGTATSRTSSAIIAQRLPRTIRRLQNGTTCLIGALPIPSPHPSRICIAIPISIISRIQISPYPASTPL